MSKKLENLTEDEIRKLVELVKSMDSNGNTSGKFDLNNLEKTSEAVEKYLDAITVNKRISNNMAIMVIAIVIFMFCLIFIGGLLS